MMQKLLPYIHIARPSQWVKNILLFVVAFFSGDIFSLEVFTNLSIAFVVFSLVASMMYILNDIADRSTDALHPIKKILRPIASGALSVKRAVLFFILLLLFTTVVFVLIPSMRSVLELLILYVVLNIGYSFFLKKIPVVEMVLVSVFYLIRVFAGGVLVGEVISDWLLISMFFVTLLVVSAKRFAESKHLFKRKVVETYSDTFLAHCISISATLAIVTYGLYSVLVAVPLHGTPFLISSLFVIIAIFRFLMIALLGKAEFPEKTLVSDSTIAVAFLCWLLTMYYSFYW